MANLVACHLIAPVLRGRAKAVMGLNPVDAERLAEVIGREHPGGRLDQLVELHFRQGHAFVEDVLDLEPALQQLGEEFLTSDGIVGQVMVRLFMAFEWDHVFDPSARIRWSCGVFSALP